LDRLLSLGARVEESLSTRRDSLRAPDLLCVEERLDEDRVEDRPEPERLLDFELDDRPDVDRLFDFELDDERLFDCEPELLELPLLLLRDREERWGILPTPPVVNP
jgi:hypothetical protein